MKSLTPEETKPLAVIASEDADYERLNLSHDAVAPWEDGARTDNRRGTYEWWYFDAHLDDGSNLVVVFMNKDLATPNDPLTPTIRIDLDLADGRSFQKLVTYDPESWHASTSGADVRIGDNRFTGDLHTYSIQATIEEITVDITLVGGVPAWRPETGYMLYGADRDEEFAWLPSVPQGAVTAKYRIGDEAHETTGVGYHDHNWGNVSLAKIVHNWYWARGQAGPYSVIASLITAHERYDYAELPIFMLARDGEVVADDSRRVRFEALFPYTDGLTGEPVATTTRYTYEGDGETWVVTFTRDRDLAKSRMIEDLRGQARTRASREVRRRLSSLRRESWLSTITGARTWSRATAARRSGSSCTSATPAPDSYTHRCNGSDEAGVMPVKEEPTYDRLVRAGPRARD